MTDRVWDRFLTEHDKAHLAMSPKQVVGYGERPALLLIDLYRWVFGDARQELTEAIKTWPGSCGPTAWDAIPHLQRLIATAREVGIPVLHVTGLDDEVMPGWSKAAHRGAGGRYVLDEAARERARHKYDIMPQVAPIDGETVLRKSSPSAFWGTPLLGQLNYLGVDTILVGGESTSGCVRSSVVDGCTNRYRMMVVEECVFDRHEACHAMSLFDLDQKYADVVALDDAVSYLRRWHAARTTPARELVSAR